MIRGIVKFWITVFVLGVIVGYCAPVHAETLTGGDSEALHFSAHFGLSYAINAVGYGIATKGLRMEPFDAWVFSTALTLLAGLSYKFLADSRSASFGNDLAKSMAYNSMGVAGFGLTLLTFNWR